MLRYFPAALFAMLCFRSIVNAQDVEPLDVIPETAVAVIRFDAPEKIKTDLSAFIDKVQPGFGGFVEAQFPTALQQISQNPTLDGLDLEQDWYMAFVLNEDNEPQPVLVLPTTAIDDAKEAVEAVFEVAENGSWLICAQDVALLEDFANDDLDSISEVLDDKTAERLAAGHIAVFINGEQLKEDFADELESADEQLNDIIDQLLQQAELLDQGINMEAVAKIYREMGRALLQAIRDSESMTVSVEFKESTFQTDLLLTTVESTPTSKFFAGQTPSELKLLKSMPEGQLGYFGFHGDPKGMVDLGKKMLEEMIEDGEVRSKLVKSLDLMDSITIGDVAGSMNILPTEDGALRYLTVGEVSPTAAVRKVWESFGSGFEYEIAGIKIKQTIESGTEEIDGLPVDIFRTEQTYPDGFDPTGIQQTMQQKLYGSDGLVQRMLMKEDRMYQTVGGGLDDLKNLMVTSSWKDKLLLDVRDGLHEKANVVVLFDLPNTIIAMFRAVVSTNAVPLPITDDQLTEINIPASFSGFSATLSQSTLESRITIPVETFQGLAKFGMAMQGMNNQ